VALRTGTKIVKESGLLSFDWQIIPSEDITITTA
jgi:hypothetical protein